MITCPVCKGWSPAETGMLCDLCQGEGVVWDEDMEMAPLEAVVTELALDETE